MLDNGCPNCGEIADLEESGLQVDKGYAWYMFFCHECGASWTDTEDIFQHEDGNWYARADPSEMQGTHDDR